MFGIGIVELAVFALGAGALVVLVLYRATHAVVVALGGPGGETAPAARAWQQVLAVRVLALAVGTVLAAFTWRVGDLGRGQMLALAVLGLCVLAGTAVGETVIRPRPPAGPRTASLRPRRVRDHLPWTAWLVATQAVLLVALMVLTTLTASTDDLGHARALACSAGGLGERRSPYPGAFYTGPLAIALLVVLGTATLAARRVVDRPRGMADTEAGDDRLRRDSLDVVVAATGVALGFPLAGLAATAGSAMTGLSEACAPGWAHPVGAVLLVVALVSLGSVAGLLGRLYLGRGPRG
ncbi:hypothetical protein G5V58_09785 [Nocardioides anomalus]|uniref:Uncharacterized protein n=1 Tax=Nocardioides anomalus TaxID=2712223 RepID=A0A6G6WCY4_9ACTN|nr:hypothetical protein [Nocardioides anomalus]QIG43013.1 hypothetical protein G5V58_09785 [Nocardioides anomalus]